MTIKIAGEIRRGITRGFGPFKKKVWEGEPFEIEVDSCDPHFVGESIYFTVSEAPGRVIVNGAVKNTPCFFGEIRYTIGERKCSFQMSVVTDIQVTGSAEITEASGKLGLFNRSSAA